VKTNGKLLRNSIVYTLANYNEIMLMV